MRLVADNLFMNKITDFATVLIEKDFHDSGGKCNLVVPKNSPGYMDELNMGYIYATNSLRLYATKSNLFVAWKLKNIEDERGWATG